MRVLAHALGVGIVEWSPAAPTLYQEYQHVAGGGGGGGGFEKYVSKLDEFETFVNRSKFAALPSSVNGAPAAAHSSAQNGATPISSHQLSQHAIAFPQSQNNQQQWRDPVIPLPSHASSQHSTALLPQSQHLPHRPPPPLSSQQQASQPFSYASASQQPHAQHSQLQQQQQLQRPFSQMQPPATQQLHVRQPAALKPKLMLLDDLPHAGDSERRQRLSQLLRQLVLGARGPVILVVTESGGSSGGSGAANSMFNSRGLHKVRAGFRIRDVSDFKVECLECWCAQQSQQSHQYIYVSMI